MAEIDAGSFQILTGGAFSGFPQFFLKADWNQDGVFADNEELSSDTLLVSWNRGKEAEEDNTPAGTLSFMVHDPFGDYVPESTSSKWRTSTSDLVTIDREVSLRIVYKDTTYPGFRGRINKITPDIRADGQFASFFCVDGFDELGDKLISAPIGTGTSGGIATSCGAPIFTEVPGASTGFIALVLDQSSWGSTRRKLDSSGEQFGWWWSYRENARTALYAIEQHERGLIYIDGDGDVNFQSSTHRNGAVSLASFNADFQNWQYAFSGRSIKNHAEISVHLRPTIALTTDIGSAPTTGFGSIASGTTFVTEIVFDKQPASSIVIPLPGRDGIDQMALVGVSGTTYGSSGGLVRSSGKVVAGHSIILSIINGTNESVSLNALEGASDTNIAIHIHGQHIPDTVVVSEASDSDSITKHHKRTFTADYIFFNDESKGSSRADSVISRLALARPDFTKFTLEGSDSNSITQILARDLSDKIQITTTGLKIVNRDYLINAAEWNIKANAPLSVVWSLEEST